MSGLGLLDNPIWSALTTAQSGMAAADDLAACFPRNVAPLAGMANQSAAAYAAMESVAGNTTIALFLDMEPVPPPPWEIQARDQMYQMIYEGPMVTDESPLIRALTGDDVPEMLALTALTEPGPFRERTIELGGYRGIFEGGRLAAMAGQRLHMTGFVEVSAVCTHPDFRGRGYGKLLVSAVMAGIFRLGERPMLHVRCSNAGAVRLYDSLGFRTRRQLHLAVMRAADEGVS